MGGEMKRCPKCEETKPLSEFYPKRSKPGAVDGYCKECRRAQSRYYSAEGSPFYERRKRARLARNKKYKASEDYKWRRAILKAVEHAVKKGDLQRAVEAPCEDADLGKCSIVHHWHHDSYAWEDRMKVRCLCSRHHGLWHRNNVPTPPDFTE